MMNYAFLYRWVCLVGLWPSVETNTTVHGTNSWWNATSQAFPEIGIPVMFRARALLMCCVYLVALMYTTSGKATDLPARPSYTLHKAAMRISIFLFYIYSSHYQPNCIITYINYIFLISLPFDIQAFCIINIPIVYSLNAIVIHSVKATHYILSKPVLSPYHQETVPIYQQLADNNAKATRNLTLLPTQPEHLKYTERLDFAVKPVCSKSIDSIHENKVYIKKPTFKLSDLNVGQKTTTHMKSILGSSNNLKSNETNIEVKNTSNQIYGKLALYIFMEAFDIYNQTVYMDRNPF